MEISNERLAELEAAEKWKQDNEKELNELRSFRDKHMDEYDPDAAVAAYLKAQDKKEQDRARRAAELRRTLK